MITVEQADQIILSQARDYGLEQLPFEQSLERVLADDILADRDLPPFNRATVDGIAVKYWAVMSGYRVFTIKATQAAGDEPININRDDECIEIMTGAALPSSTDCVIRYEDITIQDGRAMVKTGAIEKWQNLHLRGADKHQGEVIVAAGQVITPALVSIAASVGKTMLPVQKLPRIVAISSGNELVEVDETPSEYQIRKSNTYAIKSVLQKRGIACDAMHIPDDADITRDKLNECLQNYDVLLLTGGVSMGKFDYIPSALNALGVKELFHKIQQRPGKPFWFGEHANGALVFAFPGNPVAVLMCLHRYFLTWLDHINGITSPEMYAVLAQDFEFKPSLKYFLQVKLQMNRSAQLLATPLQGNGSGDFANLAHTDAFMELPLERSEFKQGEVFRIWPF